ncbi:hypothetical protein [Streptomyces sp. NBC_01262]|uniref:hypothetical protein n=1 Tax=Streptomyces sp. NBC_01262 TaxID=2903803 RepID=UPI002E352CB3|nr:hypothetical protein [Streptomyces sp. NBC_01262]
MRDQQIDGGDRVRQTGDVCSQLLVQLTGTRHEPYWTRNVTLDAYRAVNQDDAAQTLQTWAGHHGPLPNTLEDVLVREVYPTVRTVTNCYELLELAARHSTTGEACTSTSTSS